MEQLTPFSEICMTYAHTLLVFKTTEDETCRKFTAALICAELFGLKVVFFKIKSTMRDESFCYSMRKEKNTSLFPSHSWLETDLFQPINTCIQ